MSKESGSFPILDQQQADIYSIARERICHDEEVLAGRIGVLLIPYYPGLGRDIQKRTIAMYGYVRSLEDITDTGIKPECGKAITGNELTNIGRLQAGDPIQVYPDFPQGILLPLALDGLDEKKRRSILASMLQIVQGILWDNQAIINGAPLEDSKLMKRHLYASMSGFQIMITLFFGKELGGEGNSEVEDLFRNWIRYDALVDLRDDLPAGLVLFSRDELVRFGIKLEKGRPVPVEFRDLFYGLKPPIKRGLVRKAKNIRRTNIPEPFTSALWIYFISRALKLAKTQYPQEQLIFSGNYCR